MMTKLKEVLERAETWPEEAQAELAEIALEMEAALQRGVYRATPEELKAIDEADLGATASDAAFATFRRP
jgi:hypothetical protein